MTIPLLPSPGGEEPNDNPDPEPASAAPRAKRGPRPRQPQYPDADACLAALAHVAGMLAMGFMEPARANAIRAVYSQILQHHQQRQTRPSPAGLSNADLLDLLTKDPQMVSMLEPLLTDEQIALLTRGGEANAEDGQA